MVSWLGKNPRSESCLSFRISVPGTNQDVDLSDHGNPEPGTPIATWGHWEGLNQVWHFERGQSHIAYFLTMINFNHSLKHESTSKSPSTPLYHCKLPVYAKNTS